MQLRERFERLSEYDQKDLLVGTAHYLADAGNLEQFSSLLTNYDYFDIKITEMSLEDLVSDFELISNPALMGAHPKSANVLKQLELIADALRNATVLLNREPSQLSSQLWAYLQPEAGPKIAKLLSQANPKEKAWLRPLTPKVSKPGGASERMITGGAGAIVSIVPLNNGRQVLIANAQGYMMLWDLQNNRKTQEFRGVNVVVNQVIVSDDDTIAVGAYQDGTIRVWDIETGEQTHCMYAEPNNTPVYQYHQSLVPGLNLGYEVTTIAFFLGLKEFLITGHKDGTLRIWGVDRQECMKTLRSFKFFWATKIVQQPFQNYCALGIDIPGEVYSQIDYDSIGTTYMLCIQNDLESEMSKLGSKSAVKDIDFSPDGSILVFVAENITLYNFVPALTVRNIETNHQASVAAVSPDKKLLAVGYERGEIKVFDLETLQIFAEYEGHTQRISSLAFAKDSQKLLSGSQDMFVRVWRVEKNRGQKVTTAHDRHSVISLAATRDSRQILSGSWDSKIVVWDVATRKPVKTLQYPDERGQEGKAGEVEAIVITQDNKHFIATAGNDNFFSIWDLQRGKLLYGSNELENSDINYRLNHEYRYNHNRYVTCLDVSANGRYIATGSADTKVKLWEISKDKPLFGRPCDERLSCRLIETFEGHTAEINAVTFTPDGQRMVSCSDNEMIAWDINRRRKIHDFPIWAGGTCLAFFKNGRHFYSGFGISGALVWRDIEDPKALSPLGHFNIWHPNPILSAFILPDEHHAISIGVIDIKLWDLKAKDLVCTHTLESKAQRGVLTPDGKILAVGDVQGVVNFIAIERGEKPLKKVEDQLASKRRVPPPILKKKQ